ncbi:MAG: hypothetical protein RLZZ399_764 [Verrucomicrobiota bacterium]|jgi:mono/diheme cytochrome c family protein
MVCVLAAALPAVAVAEEPINYNRDIRPILAENCFSCHGPDPGGRKAGLRLDTEAGLFEKRKGDPAPVIRGNPEESELYKRLITKDQDELMPPPESHKVLKPAEVALLKRWISSGAPWQKHWSFIAPVKAPFPPVKNGAWAKNAIDRFVLAKLEKTGLAPAPEVPAHHLFRRLSLDLTGLPPKPEETAAFVSEYRAGGDEALSRWVDRLMERPAWGEHRARYWLDAARYGDTHGLHIDNYREMWLYRDWVIRAFNANKLFSEFTVEQIAGDLLPKPTEDQLIATGFQRCNITTAEGGTIPEENLANYASDRVQTMGWVYLGMTMNCAQCHDHKFDPITTRDYYSMAAFFRNTTQGHSDGNSKDGRGPVLVVPNEMDRPRWDALPALLAETRNRREGRRKGASSDFSNWLSSVSAEGILADVNFGAIQGHLPLNEGDGSGVSGLEPGRGVYTAAGELSWEMGGNLGPAPVLSKSSVIRAGNLGDFDLDQAFSFGAWVKIPKGDAKDPNGAKGDVSGTLFSRRDAAGDGRGYDLQVSGKAFVVTLSAGKDPGKELKASAGKLVKAGSWQHVFVTYDGSRKNSGIKIYVDGKEDKRKPDNKALPGELSIRSSGEFLIGARPGKSALEGLSVQDVRTYGRALTSREVKTLSDVPSVLAAWSAGVKRSGPQSNALLEFFLRNRDSEYRAADDQLAALEAERDAIRERSPLTHIQEEVKDKMPMANILMRGQYNKLGDVVEAVPPAALPPLPEGAPKNRLGLAKWLVDVSNPLTPRVTVNRFWQEVFGQGIVRTPDDFGLMGAAPVNVDLLDWLASEFRDNGGDVKQLFKLMVTSATYRQSAVATPEKLERDRDNALLSRGPRFRMDGEMVRDYALAVSGLLSSKMHGPSVRPYQPENIWDVVGLPNGDTRNYVQDKGENLYRRTLYNFWKRMAPPPNMDIFNAPSREVSCVRRERTNTPLQALVTLNDPQFVEAARRLAENALKFGAGDDRKALDFIVERVLCRPASERERAVLLEASRDFVAHYRQQPEEAKALVTVGESGLLGVAEQPTLAAWTMVCNQVMNLDEVLNK